ncbi:MAG: hypothetical protein [Wendovervirus sonii]|uniref:Peptidase MA superfamily protein n=1 Tax=phage Lak_Megaphage_Sonny TaxID=3109229 RepID=A0ABZ0Z6B0_9CAUD|nr:MAG: hypothetical protein [phage Lak_Megaphage_Sonny]
MRTLNEKAGIIEFDNVAYRNLICQISKDLKKTETFDYTLDFDELNNYKFAKYSYNFTGVLSWISTVDIYYTIDKSGNTPFIAQGIKDDFKYSDFIYIIDNGEENLTYVLFHEMCHLYDYSRFKEIWIEDEKYFFRHCNNYNINDYVLSSNVNDMSIDDIHNVFTESMYYANFTESHAFLENINFEMFEYLNKHNHSFYVFNNINEIFYKTSRTLYSIYILEQLIKRLLYIEDDIKNMYTAKYKNEIKKAYYNFSTFDKIANYLYKKLHKIVSHSRTLFNYYYNLDSIAKQSFELNESEKNLFVRRYHSGINKRRYFPFDN